MLRQLYTSECHCERLHAGVGAVFGNPTNFVGCLGGKRKLPTNMEVNSGMLTLVEDLPAAGIMVRNHHQVCESSD